MIVLRRRLKDAIGLSLGDDGGAPQLAFVEIGEAAEVHEYSVLVTSLDETTEAFGQLYRDRGDGENIFDKMKNQWGWGGYTTHDLARCRLAARLIALFYNWWNIFVRLADPTLHREAIASRPLYLTAIATRTRHARPNDDPRDQLARQGQARRSSACGRRRFPAGPGQKCGAVHPPGNLAGDPVARLPSLPQRPSPARPAPPRPKLMQPKREKPQTAKNVRSPTAGFRLNGESRHPCAANIGPSKNGRQATLTPRSSASEAILSAAG